MEEIEGFLETILFPQWILVASFSESSQLEQGESTPTHAAHLFNWAIK